MRDTARLGDDEPIRNAVGHQSVDLLRHGHVAAAQPGFDMGHRNVQLLGHDGTSQRRIHVTHHQHSIRPLGLAEFLEGHHDLRRLLRMAAAAGRHEHVGLGNTQFLEEHAIYFAVVTRAGTSDVERTRDQAGPRIAGQVNANGLENEEQGASMV